MSWVNVSTRVLEIRMTLTSNVKLMTKNAQVHTKPNVISYVIMKKLRWNFCMPNDRCEMWQIPYTKCTIFQTWINCSLQYLSFLYTKNRENEIEKSTNEAFAGKNCFTIHWTDEFNTKNGTNINFVFHLNFLIHKQKREMKKRTGKISWTQIEKQKLIWLSALKLNLRQRITAAGK